MPNVIRRSAMRQGAELTPSRGGAAAAEPLTPRRQRVRQPPHIALVPQDHPPAPQEPLETSLQGELQFDPADDLKAIVPMPASIPASTRRALTEAFAARFEFCEDLDAWLHAEHPALDSKSPFESLVAGHGHRVLAALGQEAPAVLDMGVVEIRPALRLIH